MRILIFVLAVVYVPVVTATAPASQPETFPGLVQDEQLVAQNSVVQSIMPWTLAEPVKCTPKMIKEDVRCRVEHKLESLPIEIKKIRAELQDQSNLMELEPKIDSLFIELHNQQRLSEQEDKIEDMQAKLEALEREKQSDSNTQDQSKLLELKSIILGTILLFAGLIVILCGVSLWQVNRQRAERKDFKERMDKVTYEAGENIELLNETTSELVDKLQHNAERIKQILSKVEYKRLADQCRVDAIKYQIKAMNMRKNGQKEEAMDNYKKAGDKWEEAVKETDGVRSEEVVARAYYSAGYIRQKYTNELHKAINLYKNALKKYPDDTIRAALCYSKGLAAQYLGTGNKPDIEKAIKNYSEAIGYKPGYVEALYHRGLAHQEGRKKYDEAIKDYTEALRNNPDDEMKPDLYYRRGLAHQSIKEHNKAIEDYTVSLANNPDDKIRPDLYYRRGLAYQSIEKYAQAIEDYTVSLANKPGDKMELDMYYNRGLAYQSIGEYDQAIKDYDRALANNPDDDMKPDLYYRRGLARVKLPTPDMEGAIKDYDAAIKIKPDYVDAINSRREAKLKCGDENSDDIS